MGAAGIAMQGAEQLFRSAGIETEAVAHVESSWSFRLPNKKLSESVMAEGLRLTEMKRRAQVASFFYVRAEAVAFLVSHALACLESGPRSFADS